VSPSPRARKGLGQHWLVEGRYLSRIAAAGDITDVDTVIEVGPGTGLLTERLAARASRLIAVESTAADRTAAGEVRGAPTAIVEGDALIGAEDTGGKRRQTAICRGAACPTSRTAIVTKFLRTYARWMVATRAGWRNSGGAATMGYLAVQTQVSPTRGAFGYRQAFRPP
jgi:hypothetical protein